MIRRLARAGWFVFYHFEMAALWVAIKFAVWYGRLVERCPITDDDVREYLGL